MMIFALAASVSLSIEFLCFLVVVSLCCLFAVVIYWVVRANKNLNKRVEGMFEEENKKREEDQRNLKTSIKDDFINLRILMFQDYKKFAEEIKIVDAEAREHLKSLANELMSRTQDEKPTPLRESSKIDGKESLRRGLETQKKFTDDYKLGHKRIRRSLKRGQADIVDLDKNGKVSEVVAVKSFDLEITERGKTCRNVKGHKYAVSLKPSRDAKAEVETARRNGLSKIRLVVFNLRTGHKIFDGFVSFDEKIKIRENAPAS